MEEAFHDSSDVEEHDVGGTGGENIMAYRDSRLRRSAPKVLDSKPYISNPTRSLTQIEH